MRISTKGRYALRTLLDLAMNDAGGPVCLKAVAERQEISEKYLEQIISVLNRAGLVRSVRGAGGGYFLTMPPQDYTVGMILRLTEGCLNPVDCVLEGPVCPRESACAVRMLWKRLNDAICGVVDEVTLADLVSWQEAMGDGYVI